MNMNETTKARINTILSTANDEQERQKLTKMLLDKGYSQSDLTSAYPALSLPMTVPSTPATPAQSTGLGGFVDSAMNGFGQSAVGRTLAAAGSGFVEGAIGLNPEQAASNVSKAVGGKPIETLQSGMSVKLPFLDGSIDPARTVGQVAGSIVSPYSKIKFAGAILNRTLGAVARNFGNTAVMALQDKLDPNGELSFNDLASLIGADVAGALVQKLIPGAGATADNVLSSRGGPNISEIAGSTAGTAKPVASDISQVGFGGYPVRTKHDIAVDDITDADLRTINSPVEKELAVAQWLADESLPYKIREWLFSGGKRPFDINFDPSIKETQKTKSSSKKKSKKK